MRHGSLFSGIGGFDLAAQWMGWENVFQVEWDGFCQKVLAKNFPNVKRYGDIKEFDGTKYRGLIDIISGGFPCQPFSHAGKRKGKEDDRYLWPEMLRVIREVKPTYVVGENVAGLVSMENGKTLDQILSDLENEGYTTEQVIIPACAVGAWHRRDRIWIIAYCQSERTRGLRNEGKTERTPNSNELSGELCGIFSDTISERRCSGNTKREYAANVRELRRSQTDGYWDSEPHLGRVVARLSSTLDETLNDYKNGNANNQETITKIDLFRGQILRDMWNEQCPSSETSHRTEERQSNDFMLSMSHGYSHEKWKLGQRFKDNKDLSDLWQRILSAPLKETQDLQSGMLERVREIERNEKVASSRIDRLKGLGNAIVPQVAFQIFKAIEQYNELRYDNSKLDNYDSI